VFAEWAATVIAPVAYQIITTSTPEYKNRKPLTSADNKLLYHSVHTLYLFHPFYRLPIFWTLAHLSTVEFYSSLEYFVVII
jgi:hypothetical protein